MRYPKRFYEQCEFVGIGRTGFEKLGFYAIPYLLNRHSRFARVNRIWSIAHEASQMLYVNSNQDRENIAARRPRMIPTTPSHVTQRVQVVVNAPLVYVQGNADWGVAEQATIYVQQGLKNVVIEASTPAALATHKRIRTGTTMISPTTLKPSSTSGQSVIFEGGGSGGSLGGSGAPAGGGKPWTYY